MEVPSVAETATEVFSEINGRLEDDPAKLAGINATYAFDLDGSPYHITIKNGKGEAAPGKPDQADITITMKEADFVDLASGKLNPTTAFMSGKLKIQGDMGLAMKLQTILI